MTEKFKAAIIGLGHQATEDHIPGIKDSNYAQLVAVCDIDPIKVEEWSKKLSVNGYTNVDAMLEAEKLDFALIATPHDSHLGIVKKLANKKIHILKEKPFAMSLNDGKEIKELCDKNGVHLITTLQRRFNPIYNSYFQLKEYIGEPFFIDIKYTIYTDSPYSGWRGCKELAGGGCIMDMGYHMIDMLIWYFGLPDKIHAEFSSNARPEVKYDAEDTATIMFCYADKVQGSLIISRCQAPKTESIKVMGSRGTIEVERGKIRRFNSEGQVVESLIRENSWPSASTSQIDYFCKVLRNEKENTSGPNYHLNHLAFIEACYKSKQTGAYVNPRSLLDNNGK